MKRTRIQAARRHKRDQADLAVTRKETGCSVPRSHKAIVLWSLCSIHRSLTCQHWFCTVPFGHSVPSTLSTLVLYSVLCSLCSSQYVHVLYSVLWSFCSICTVHTGSIRCPLVSLFHPPSAHRFYTVSFAHSVPPSTYRFCTVSFARCSIRPVHTDLRQCSIITQFQYTHFTL